MLDFSNVMQIKQAGNNHLVRESLYNCHHGYSGARTYVHAWSLKTIPIPTQL